MPSLLDRGRSGLLSMILAASLIGTAAGAGARESEAVPELTLPAVLDTDRPSAREVPQARGVLRPGAEAVLSSQIAGKVLALPFREGESFKKGDVLAELDCRYYQAQLSAAEAAEAAARIQLESDRQLASLNSIGVFEVQMSEAKLRQAEAETTLGRVLTDRCVVRAPYDGVLVERLIHPHESVAQDTRLISIVARATPEIRLVVPSHWLPGLTPGTPFQFHLDELDQTYPAKITAVGGRIDPVSQTLPVTGAFVGKPPGLVPGMSGTAHFERVPGLEGRP